METLKSYTAKEIMTVAYIAMLMVAMVVLAII